MPDTKRAVIMKKILACLLLLLLFHVSAMTQSKFEIQKAWIEHNIFKGGNDGMNIYLDFTARDFKGGDGVVVIYFENPKNTQLTDKNGKVVVSKSFSPQYDNANYTKFTIWMPYSAIPLKEGSSRSQYYCNIKFVDSKNNKWFPADKYVQFAMPSSYKNTPKQYDEASVYDRYKKSRNSPASSYAVKECRILGDIFYYGRRGEQKDYRKAAEFYNEASANRGDGYDEYCIEKTIDCYFRLGNKTKVKEMTEWLCDEYGKHHNAQGLRMLLLARKYNDNPLIDCVIGEYYYEGYAGSPNYSKGKEYFKKAALRGNSKGIIFMVGAAINEKEWDQMFFWISYYEKKLNKTYPYKQSYRESTLKEGKDWYRDRDYEKAATLYRLSSELGSREAMKNLGDMYRNGQGVPKDYSQALYWYNRGGHDYESRELTSMLQRNHLSTTRSARPDNASIDGMVVLGCVVGLVACAIDYFSNNSSSSINSNRNNSSASSNTSANKGPLREGEHVKCMLWRDGTVGYEGRVAGKNGDKVKVYIDDVHLKGLLTFWIPACEYTGWKQLRYMNGYDYDSKTQYYGRGTIIEVPEWCLTRK